MRLEKWLAASGVASRRKSKELILNGEITVNDEVITTPSFLVSSTDEIKYNNKIIEKEELVYYLLNKPKNIISSVTDDRKRQTVIDLLDEEHKKERLYPVGRLDFNTSGAIILTNDGDLSYILTRPEYLVPKTYVARVKGLINKPVIRKMEQGLQLEGYKTRPAVLKVLEKDFKTQTTLVELTITEGKNHQVKDMFKHVEHPVISLTRTHFDFLTVEGLARGTYRKLKIHEIKRLYANEQKKV